MIAHVGAFPVEEALLPVAAWAGLGLVLARGALASARVRCQRMATRRRGTR